MSPASGTGAPRSATSCATRKQSRRPTLRHTQGRQPSDAEARALAGGTHHSRLSFARAHPGPVRRLWLHPHRRRAHKPSPTTPARAGPGLRLASWPHLPGRGTRAPLWLGWPRGPAAMAARRAQPLRHHPGPVGGTDWREGATRRRGGRLRGSGRGRSFLTDRRIAGPGRGTNVRVSVGSGPPAMRVVDDLPSSPPCDA